MGRCTPACSRATTRRERSRRRQQDPVVDLVVVGHGLRGPLARAISGSVADRLVQICQKSVLVVR